MYKYDFSATSKKSTFWSRTNITYRSDNTATQIYPSHPGDRITCSPPPSVTQLGGGCLKAVTLTHSSILPNHPPTVPHSRGEQERGRGRQTQGEELTREGEEWWEEEEEENEERNNRRVRRGDKHMHFWMRKQDRGRPNVCSAVCHLAAVPWRSWEKINGGRDEDDVTSCLLPTSQCAGWELIFRVWGHMMRVCSPHLHELVSLRKSPALNRSSLSRCAEDAFYFYRFYSRQWVVLTHFFHV